MIKWIKEKANDYWNRFKSFCSEVTVKSTLATLGATVITFLVEVSDFLIDFYTYFESIVLLLLAAFGLSNIVASLLKSISMPTWINPTMVAPVLGVVGVVILAMVSIYRGTDSDVALA